MAGPAQFHMVLQISASTLRAGGGGGNPVIMQPVKCRLQNPDCGQSVAALGTFCSGHIGYGIVAWRRGEGLATSALKAFLPEAKALGLRFVEITTRPDNPASVRVIEKAGGQLIESSAAHTAIGGHDILKFNVPLG